MIKLASFILLLGALKCSAQIFQGELRVLVVDNFDLPVEASLDLVSQRSQTHQNTRTDISGRQTFRGLPFGAYVLEVHRKGFVSTSRLIEVQSQLPQDAKVQLGLAPLITGIDVSATLLDSHEPGTHNYIGSDRLATRPISLPGRAVLDLISQQPGWVQEGSGVVHPRGVDNGTQYLIDGFPITDIRSPAFAPELSINSFESMNVLTSGYPAEYGRRLGAIVEVNTNRSLAPGWHGKALAEDGSFQSTQEYLGLSYARAGTALGMSGTYGRTDRYLDPPVQFNYTNHGAELGQMIQVEHDCTERDRVRLAFSRSRTNFLVPNELIQQAAGQRQDRQSEETLGQASYQRILSPNLLADTRVMVRDLSAGLESNPLSTPVLANQDRGFRETYLKTALTADKGQHEFKAGAEAIFTSIREKFGYSISDPSFFDPDVPRTFLFNDRRQSREQSAFAQDLYRYRNLTVSLGMRFDHYKLLVDESALSPRAGISYYLPGVKLVLHGSYDRVFQPPPIQNLLLSSSKAARELAGDSAGLPVPSSRGNFLEGGFSKTFFGHLRLDANYFRRDIRNWSDDNFLLNTGISFPTSNRRAEIRGLETKLSVPMWGRFSGFITYTNQAGIGHFPLTGGLIFKDVADALGSKAPFQLSTVQRNTTSASLLTRLSKRYWVAVSDWYGSGLPFELEGEPDVQSLEAQYGRNVISRIDFDRGRLRPSYSLDLSAGGMFRTGESASFRLQGDILNATDHLNLLNFAGLFSGTAIAAPRSYHVRLSFEF